jgi:hypothetical protein
MATRCFDFGNNDREQNAMAWKRGKSGNPGGRAKKEIIVRDLARTYTVESVRRLATWMRHRDFRASIPASIALIDRGWGRPSQETTLNIEDKRDATDWTREELVAILNELRASGARIVEAQIGGEQSDSVHRIHDAKISDGTASPRDR